MGGGVASTGGPDDEMHEISRQSAVRQFGGRLGRRALKDVHRVRRRASARVRDAPERTRERVAQVVHRAVAEFPETSLNVVRGYRSMAGGQAAARIDTVLTARIHGWEAAAARLDDAGLGSSERSVRFGPSFGAAVMAPGRVPPALALASPALPRDGDLPGHVAERIVVYTARFGSEVPLPPLHVVPQGVRFVCVTDREGSTGDWEVSVVEPLDGDTERSRAWARIHPHEVLRAVAPERDRSLYVDPDRVITGNLQTLLTRWLLAHDVVMFRHHSAAGWWDLAEEHVLSGAASTEAIAAFADLGRQEVPTTAGAFDTGVVWRHHRDGAVLDLARRWWELTERLDSLDDVALAVVAANSPATAPKVLPRSLGDGCDSMFVAKVPAPAAPPPQFARTETIGGPGRSRTTVVFLRDPVANTEITTTLRGAQLSRLIAERCPAYDVVYTDDRASVTDSVVILLKQTLQHLSADEIDQLRRRNVAVVNCWDDQAPDRDRMLAADAQMVLAFGQLVELRRRCPERSTFLVTHHVNLDFPHGCPPQDHLRMGYFGAAYNTRLPPSLSEVVDLVPTAVLDGDDSARWMQRLTDYNCHWAIRQRQYWDGWKPFLKGFIAARYGAPVVVAPDDDDARYYLGDDYPFYATGVSDEELELLVVTMQAAFGGPEWELARAIMRQVADRSSNDTVCADFRRMVDQLAR
jgi:hypothetical protein